ncbi:MAG TPA: hypothetical protein VMN37_11255 [Gemmatimonadales bacterium]|nr:hypothetical protein [Gemmatimonadales bacterium]
MRLHPVVPGAVAALVVLTVPARPLPAQLALGAAPPAIRTEADLTRFLDDLELQQWVLNRAGTLEAYAQWKGEPHHQVAGIRRLSTGLSTRRDYARVVEQWKGRVKDSTLARRLEVQGKYFLPAKADPALALALADLQTAIQDTFQQFRYRLGGQALTQTQLFAVIDSSADRELRRAAFEAITQISPRSGAPIRQAMTMTDRIGRQQGFTGGAAARLFLSSLTPTQVLRDLDAFEQATRGTYEAVLARVRRDLGLERVEAWDLDYWFRTQERAVADAYPLEQALPRTRALASGLGFPVDSLPITVTIQDVPTGGVAFPIRPPYEARLLSNPFSGVRFYSTLFHEYGHTLHATRIRADLPLGFLTMDEQPASEGLGETLGHFAFDRRFLARVAGVNPEQAAALERLGKLQQLLWLRRSIGANAYAEVQAYLDLEADFDSVFTAAYRRFVGVELPPGDYAATRDLFGTRPLYYPAYLYANMIATQLREAMRREFGTEDLSRESRVAEWLTRHFYGPGQSVAWPEKVRRATGRPLDARALAEYLAVEVGG